ncbi:MAG: type VI secretion system baseplate subunit TssK [candidate division Zixibacteria bacterium]|nr:type VI secretion system baseplate subunit TssK [candidate division Zixibacteria bacterium]
MTDYFRDNNPMTAYGKLARIRWQSGQLLLPEHLIAQEEAIVADSVMRFQALGVPAYGITNLIWDDILLSQGVLSVEKLDLILRSGLLLQSSNNMQLIPLQLDLNGVSPVSVFGHLFIESSRNLDSKEKMNSDEAGLILRTMFKMVFAVTENYPEPLQDFLENHKLIETLKLAEFEKGRNGNWRLSENFVPPLLQTGISPFLKTPLSRLLKYAEYYRTILIEDDAYCQDNSIESYAKKQCLRSLIKLKRILNSNNNEIHAHPYFMFEELLDVYESICINNNLLPDDTSSNYKHDDLAGCMGKIIEALIAKMREFREDISILNFKLNEGINSLTLPDNLTDKDDIFLVIENKSEEPGVKYEMPVLADRTRLELINMHVLDGILVDKATSIPYRHHFDINVEAFKVLPGKEWDYALKNGVLSFYEQRMYDHINFYIVIRKSR